MSSDGFMETPEESSDSELKRTIEESVIEQLLNEVEQEVHDEQTANSNKGKIEVLVQLGREGLRTFKLSDCYATDRPGMHLEILPKILYDSADEDSSMDDVEQPIFRKTVDAGTQASVQFKENDVQTSRSRLVNSWCQCEPRVFSEAEIEEHLKQTSFQAFKNSAEESLLASLVQNKIADSFIWDLTSLSNEIFIPKTEKEEKLMISGSYYYFESNEPAKEVTSINWHSSLKDFFVVSSVNSFPLERKMNTLLKWGSDSVFFHVWSIKNQFFPKLNLECFDDLHVLRFNPSLSYLIAGGSVTGQLVLWDTRPLDLTKKAEDSEPSTVRCCAVSIMDRIHKHGLTCLYWVPSHFEIAGRGEITMNPSNGYQLITSGLDGFIQIWDLRIIAPGKPSHTSKRFHHLDSIWEPFHIIEVFSPDGRKRKSLTCLVLRNVNNSTLKHGGILSWKESEESMNIPKDEYYGGCDDGNVLCGSFKLIKDETGKFIARIPEYFNSPHNFSVTALECSPFFKDVFFSIGGKTIAIWKHSIKAEPIYLRDMHSYITCGQWSPKRPSLFVLGYQDGCIEVWDFLHSLYKPLLEQCISTSEITSLTLHVMSESEHIVAAGDTEGVVYTIDFPQHLWTYSENEFKAMKHLLDIEASRIADSLIPPSTTDTQDDKPKEQLQTIEDNMEEPDLSAVYDDFLKLQESTLKQLGLFQEHLGMN